MFDFVFCCCCVRTFLSKKQYLLRNFAIPFVIVVQLVYLIYCNICGRLKGERYTDLAYLNTIVD